MEEFYIEYLIENNYEETVRKANYQLLVMPEKNQFQKVLDYKFFCSEKQEIHFSKNIFGFETINYYITLPFTKFWFKLFVRIHNQEFNPFKISLLLPNEEFERINSPGFQIDNHIFLTETELTKMPKDVDVLFPAYSGKIQLLDYLTQLNNFIFELLEYSPESTDINTPISEVLRIRKGVCQDFAHLFISVCRKNKIPTRYVSGYLHQGAAFIGSSQLHAWVEAFIPELGWIGFDATNNLLADNHYIKIAHGTEYRDCSPIIGVLETTGLQKSTHSVKVTNQ